MTFHTALRRLRFVRRKVCELAGYGGYSHLAAHDMDRKIERYLDFDGGFFIEAGAHDGQAQSNTYYFETMRKWYGVLIEPNARLAAICRKRRPHSQVVHAALVGPAYDKETIELTSGELDAAVIDNSFRNLKTGSDSTKRMTAPTKTLTRVLDELLIKRDIDLFSLDVEGYEPEVLRGLDFSRYAPRFLCIEVHDRGAIDEILATQYEQAEVLYDAGPYQDILFRRR